MLRGGGERGKGEDAAEAGVGDGAQAPIPSAWGKREQESNRVNGKLSGLVVNA